MFTMERFVDYQNILFCYELVSIPFQMTQELDLNVPICDQSYIVNGNQSGASPPVVLVLQSELITAINQIPNLQLTRFVIRSCDQSHDFYV